MKQINRQLLQMTRVGGSEINEKANEVTKSSVVIAAD